MMNWNSPQFDGALPIPIRAARQVGKVLKHVPMGQKGSVRVSLLHVIAAQYDLNARKSGEDIRVLVDLFLDRQLMSDRDDSEPAVFKSRPNFLIAGLLICFVVMRPVDEYADTGSPVAFVKEVGLNHNLVGRPVLRQIG